MPVQDDLAQHHGPRRLWLLARRHGDLRGCQQPTPGSIGAFRRRASVVVPDDLVAGRSASCAAAAPARSSHRRRGRASPRRHRLTTLPSAHGSRRQSGLRLFRRPTARSPGWRAGARCLGSNMYSECEVTDMFTTIVAGSTAPRRSRRARAGTAPRRPRRWSGRRRPRASLRATAVPRPAADVEALAHDEAQALLEEQLAEAGVEARAIATAETSPGRGLHRIADALEADLVVIGSPHRGSLGRVVAGDTARAVIQGAACPVLVARHSARRRSPARSSASLTTARPRAAPRSHGRDDSPSLSALRSASSARRSPRGILTQHLLRHQLGRAGARRASSTPRPSWPTPWPSSATAPPAKRSPASPATSWSGCPTRGPPGPRLRGYGPVRRALLGGSADRIVHAAACPVLVVPRGAHEDHATERAAAAEVIAGLTGDLTPRRRAPSARGAARARRARASRWR